MKPLNIFITSIVFFTIVFPGFSQENTPEEYIVKVVYFVSKDREPSEDVNTKIRQLVQQVHKFYADQMESYGYGRKTFRFESYPNGEPVVHRIIGTREGKLYQQAPYEVFGEFANRLQTRNTILFVVLDHGYPTIAGAGGVAFSGARMLIPATGGSFGLRTAAHELGHTFSLPHDFRDNTYIMSYGWLNPYRISKCAARWLSVSPYFNPKRIIANKPGRIHLLPSSVAYPPDQTHVFFEITDPDGLYHARFMHHHTLILNCKELKGDKELVKFIANTAMNKRVLVEAVDVNGHIIYGPWHALEHLEPQLILDITGDVTDMPDTHNIQGPWLWMLVPTEQGQGGSASTDIDSLAVASANTITEETVAKKGASKDWQVGDYTWTQGKLPPHRNINAMLVNIGMTENPDLDDHTAYALTTLVSPTDQPNVLMRARSDDSIKVWLNGEVVLRGTENRTLNEAIDNFRVNLKKGDNLLLVKVSERAGAWGMQVGIDAEVFPVYRSVPITLPVYGVALNGTCDLTPEIIKEGADIAYSVTVINTGNTKDTITLTTSGNTTHSRMRKVDVSDQTTSSRVSLEPGASTKVELRVPGFVRATAGNYVLKVKATSESDSTKTAEILTTATVKPVQGVALSSLDDLTAEITDVNTDAKYAITVTNTGNTKDKITLETALPSTLSRNTVSLDPGASKKVILTLPSDALKNDNDAIHVIATSKKDNTKTAEIKKTYQPRPDMLGPWLWMLVPTEQGQGGSASTDIDSLAVASADTITEQTVAQKGANEGESVGDHAWTLGKLPPHRNINAMLNHIGMTENPDLDDHTAYALITLVSKKDQPDVLMRARSDDSIKVWLNGEVVLKNATNRQLNDAVDVFPVNIKKGDNLLLVKVSERAGAWGMQVGIDADIFPVYRTIPTTKPVYGVSIEGASNLTTEASDVTSGIKYILKVTNTGNTKDTITLATEGKIKTVLSQPSVWLAPGASAKVTLTIPSTEIAAAGEYAVKVTATSASDSTKTAEILTTATIKP